VHGGHVDAESVASFEGLGAEGAGVQELPVEVHGLQMVAHLGRDRGLELAQGATGHPASGALLDILAQIRGFSCKNKRKKCFKRIV